MTRTLYVERLYSMGNYENIKFSNSLKDIPEEVALNPNAVGLLFLQQLLSCEEAYLEYKKLVETIAQERLEDALEILKQKREQTYSELLSEITPEKTE